MDKHDEQGKRNEIEELKKIGLIWQSSESLPTIYSNQVLISHTGPEFYLIFGEVSTPAILGDIAGTVPEKLSVKPLIKIAITPTMMIQMAQVISDNVNRFIEMANASLEKK